MVRVIATFNLDESTLRENFTNSESLCRTLQTLGDGRPYIKSVTIDAEVYPLNFWIEENKE